MMQPQNSISFVQISDTHIGPDAAFELRGFRTAERAAQVIDKIAGLPFKPSFVIHTGDVVADPDERSYRLARQTFARLEELGIPVRYVTGNHDAAKDLRPLLSPSGIDNLSYDPDFLTYAFSVQGHRFIVLDAKPSGTAWRGALAEHQFDFLAQEIAAAPNSLTVFLHYPSRELNVPWIEERMLLQNGLRLHHMLRALPAGTVRGVFSGHIHCAASVVEDAILYQSAPATSMSFRVHPNQLGIAVATDPTPMFSVVSFQQGRTIVTHHQG
jgi:3',5'-cyclic AMP phosphodiesterase CpdA